MPPPAATAPATSRSSSHPPHPRRSFPDPIQIPNPVLSPTAAAAAARRSSTHIHSTNTTSASTPRFSAIRKTSSAIYLVFQFMQCCLVPPEIESVCATPASASPYSGLSDGCGGGRRARGGRRGETESEAESHMGMQMQMQIESISRNGNGSPTIVTPRASSARAPPSAVATPRTSSRDSMELECVTLRNCPLFCDDGNPTDEPDLPAFASIHGQMK